MIQPKSRLPGRTLTAAGAAAVLLAACQQDKAEKLVTAPASIALKQAETVISDSRRAIRTFLQVMTPGTTCLARLRRKGVRFETVPDKKTERGCGYTSAVRVTGFGDVGLSKPIILRCAMAERVSDWVENTVQPAADALLQTRVTELLVSSGYRCRNSRGLRWGKLRHRLSQHAYANAFDIWGMKFANGRHTRVRDHWKFNLEVARKKAQVAADKLAKANRRTRSRMMLAAIRLEKQRQNMTRSPKLPKKAGDYGEFWRYVSLKACNTFNKVFTPEYDRVHRHHLHFDLAANRLCGLEGEHRRRVIRKRRS